MPTHLHRLYAYHRATTPRVLDAVLAHREALPARSYPLLCHVVNAHQMWNVRVSGGESLRTWDVHTPEDFRRLDAGNHATTMGILAEGDLEREVGYADSAGATFTRRLSDILLHVANHTTHHRGQVIADVRASGFAPPVTDYIYWLPG